MSTLLETIEAFNRKERFFLFAYATGNHSRGLKLSDEFRMRLGEALGLEVPPDAKGFIDYHLDWLHAAVLLARGEPPTDGPRPNWDTDSLAGYAEQHVPWVSTGNQEDIDLLVAYERDGATWLLMVEAKAETGWTNSQIRSKAKRLGRIFSNQPIDGASPIQPRFCLMSPAESQGLKPAAGENWPEWMVAVPPSGNEVAGKFAWLKLTVPPGRRKVTGCDIDGHDSSKRTHWKVEAVASSDKLVE